MSKEKSPAFQFYPKDYLTDTRVMMMDLATQGAYLRALFICWIEGGTITADPKKLSTQIGARCTVRIAEAVIALFTVSEDGLTMRHKRLDREREKQEAFSQKNAENANKRWKKTSQTNPKPMPPHMPDVSQTDALHLHSSISFSDINTPPFGENENLNQQEYKPPVVKLEPFIQVNQESSLRAATVESESWLAGMAQEFKISPQVVRARAEDMIKKHVLKKSLETWGWQRVMGFMVDDWRKKESPHRSPKPPKGGLNDQADDTAEQEKIRQTAEAPKLK